MPWDGRAEGAPQRVGASHQWQAPNNAAFVQPLDREGPHPYGAPAPYDFLYRPQTSTQEQYGYYPSPPKAYAPYGAPPFMPDQHYRGGPDPRALNMVPQQAPHGPGTGGYMSDAGGCMTGVAAASAAILCCMCGIG